jgi:DNA-binding PadR family transcriptional regulator
MGPRRRVYSLLEEGHRQLQLWVEDLRRTRTEIDRLLNEYREAKDPQSS